MLVWPGVCIPAPDELRVLPLNRFPDSRHIQAGPNSFYLMPTAVEDDYFDGTSPLSRVQRHFSLAHKAGATYFRCAFSWNGIEKTKGTYDWTFWDQLVSLAEQNHIGLIPYVAYTPRWGARDEKEFWKQPPVEPQLYADFMYRIALRYRGRIAAWEIWNEPDNHDYWTGTVQQFAELVKLAAGRIRDADPNAVLVLGGMSYGLSPFLDNLLSHEHIERYVDVIALHAYPESWSNERAETVFQEWIPAVADALARAHSDVDLWVNEMGYADYRFNPNRASIYGTQVFYRYEHTQHYQAAMLFKFQVMALASSRVSLTGWYRVDDFASSETRLGNDFVNYHLGVVDARGKPKPALRAFAFFRRLFSKPSHPVNSVVRGPENSQAVVNVFETADREVILVAWLRSSRSSEIADPTGTLQDRRSETISVGLPCARARVAGYFDPEGRRVRTPATVVDKSIEGIQLRGGQVFTAELACAT